jgi:two-component system, response regulator YesN
MRILVVDDESLVRENVVDILNRMGFYELSEAQDGIEALKRLDVIRPDVIIADIRMPEMDGIEFLSRSREISKDILFILLSGYDLFEYAQAAIQHGAFAYLVKPVNSDELQAVMDKAVKTIDQKNKQKEYNSSMRIGGTQGVEFLKSRMIFELITCNSADQEYYIKKLKELNISLDYEVFLLFLVSIDNFSTLDRVDSRDRQLLKFSIENIVMEMLVNQGILGYPFDLEDGKGFLLNVSSDCEYTNKLNFYALLKSILSCIHLNVDFNVTIGAGDNAKHYSDLSNSYHRAQKSISQRLSKGGGQVYMLDELPASKDISARIDFKLEQELMACFERCDMIGSANIIESLYKPFKDHDIIDVGSLQKLNFQLILLIYKIMNALGSNPEEILGDEFILYNNLNAHSSIDSIFGSYSRWLGLCFSSITVIREKGYMKLMEIAKSYIESNYAKNITLESISDHVHLSTAYFSKQFKFYLNENFVDYLNNFRMNKAKELLKDGIYKASDVAKMVGFNDEKYFYKVFKRHTGFTPTEFKNIYRNSR